LRVDAESIEWICPLTIPKYLVSQELAARPVRAG
jgi:hypothetical protein